jgi:tetratricopeptide (TPR) repeat protein
MFCCSLALAQLPEASEDAQAHANQGMHLLQTGELAGAEAELRQAVQKAPGDAAFLGTLGAILGMEHKLAESNEILEKALSIDPLSTQTRRNLASNQFQLGDLVPARENLQLLLKNDPADKSSTLLLGMVDEELKDYSSAIRLLSSVPDQVVQRPQSISALARAYYNTGQTLKAHATLHLLRDPEGVFMGGQVAAQAHDLPTAEQMFASIQSTYSDRTKLGYHLARAQYQAKHFVECQATLQSFVDAGHATSEIENLLGWCYEGQGDFVRAVAAMDKAIEEDPANESNYLDVGRILLEAHRPKGALEAAKTALSLAPDSARAYGLKGLAESDLSQPIDAVQSYLQAVKLDPTDSKALLGLALAQEREGKTQDAQATFEKGIQQFPSNAALYQEYGKMLLIFRGDDPEASEAHAVSLLTKALALENTLAVAYFELGNLALSKGQVAQAVTQLEAAAKLSPDDSRAHYALSRAYRRLGRVEDADRELKTFQSLKGKGTE